MKTFKLKLQRNFTLITLMIFQAFLISCRINNEISAGSSNVGPSSPTITLNNPTISATEGDVISAHFSLSEPSPKLITFSWTILLNGTEAIGEISPSSGQSEIAAGSSTVSIDLTVANDNLFVGDRVLTIDISNVDGAEVSSTDQGSISITDDDAEISYSYFEDTASFSYVDLDVDWSRKLAYAATRRSGKCFEIIDFSDEMNPVVIKTIGSATTPSSTGNTCLGIQLFDNNTKLAVSVYGSNQIEIWDLGANPSLLGLTRDAATALTKPENVAGIVNTGPNNWDVFVVRRAGVAKFDYDSSLSQLNVTFNPGGLSNDHNGGVYTAKDYFITAGWSNAAPIEIIDSTGAPDSLANMDNGGSSGLWSAAASPDGTKVFMGGWVSGFLKFTPAGVPSEYSLTSRIDNDSAYRTSIYYLDGSTEYFVGAKAGTGILDFFNVDDIDNPFLESTIVLPDHRGELYGVRINSSDKRAAVVSNKGDFFIVDTTKRKSATAQFPTF